MLLKEKLLALSLCGLEADLIHFFAQSSFACWGRGGGAPRSPYDARAAGVFLAGLLAVLL